MCDFVFSQDFCSAVTVVYNSPYVVWIIVNAVSLYWMVVLSFTKEFSINSLSFKHTVAHAVSNRDFQLALR